MQETFGDMEDTNMDHSDNETSGFHSVALISFS